MTIVATDWSRRVQITDANVSPTLTGFVALLTEANLPSEIWTTALNGGGDLRVCLNSDGTSQLPLEVVSFDTSAQTAVLWLRLPTFASGDSLWLFYDKPAETQPAATDTFGRNAVWADYEYHSNDGGQTETTNSYTFTDDGSGSATSDYLGTPNGALNAPRRRLNDLSVGDVVGDYTIETWFNGTNSGTHISKRDGTLTQYQTGIVLYRLFYRDASPNDFEFVAPFVAGWNKVNYSVSGNTVSVYLNGSFLDSQTIVKTSRSIPLRIGYRGNGGLGTVGFEYAGAIAKNGIYSTAKSANYISTEYANQSSPATFWSTGTPENTGGGGATVTAGVAFNIPSLNVSSTASATLPQPGAAGSFDLQALTVASSASATIPQPSASAAFDLPALTVIGASSATLPQPSLTGAFNLNALTVSANATSTTPNFTASGTFNLPALTISGASSATQPNPTASGSFDIGTLLFSGTSSATLPQPSASGTFNLNTFSFNGNATVTEPTFTASGAFNLSALSVSGSASATFPQPSASCSFALPQIQINGTITVSGLVITTSKDAILYASVGDGVNYKNNTSNILYLH